MKTTRISRTSQIVLTCLLLIAVAGVTVVVGAAAQRTPAANLLKVRRVGTKAYFAYELTGILSTYDLQSRAWLADIDLGDSLTAYDVDEEGIYAAFGRKVVRFDLDGSNEQIYTYADDDIHHLYAFDDFITFGWYYDLGGGRYDAKTFSIDKVSGTQLGYWERGNINLGSGAAGRTLNRLYGGQFQPSSTMDQLALNEDGSFIGWYSSEEWIHGTELFISDDEGVIYSEDGFVASATDLSILASLDIPDAGIDDITFVGNLPIILSDKTVIAFSKTYQETGRHTLGEAPNALEAYDNTIFAFRTVGSAIEVETMSVDVVSPDDPDAFIDATTINVDPDFIDYDNGIVYLYSRNYRSIFRWSVEEKRYLDPVEIRFAANHVAYSPDDDTFYLAHSAEKYSEHYYGPGTIDTISADGSTIHYGVVTDPSAISAVATTDQYLVTCQNDSESTSIFTVVRDLNGDVVYVDESVDCRFRHSAWIDDLRRLYTIYDYGWLSSTIVNNDGSLEQRFSVASQPPINVLENGTRIIDGNGQIMDAETLEHVNVLPNDIADAVWHANTLYTVVGDEQSRSAVAQKWHTNTTIDQEVEIMGTPLSLSATPEGLLVVSQWLGKLRFSLFDADLNQTYGPEPGYVNLPAVVRDYCTDPAPFSDDFSDPSSGWPRINNDVYSADYYNGVYRILHNNANYWAAFSRGDVWDESALVELKGEIVAGDAVWGIVYGLRDDWSEFYTFEIIPSAQQWFRFRYDVNSGWELLSYGKTTVIKEVGTNRLTLEKSDSDPDQVNFKINGVKVKTHTVPSGRVGLTGGSFTKNTEIHYDDYLFDTADCETKSSRSVSVNHFISERAIAPFMGDGK